MTYQIWKEQNFTAAELLNAAVSGPEIDLDNDGLNTVLEYALGLNPKISDASVGYSASFTQAGGNDYLAMTLRRQKNAIDLTYKVQVDDTLQSWTETTAAVGIPTDNADGTETITIRDTVSLTNGKKRFIRLQVTLSE